MSIHQPINKPSGLWLAILTLILALAPVTLVKSFQAAPATNGDGVAVTYLHGNLHATIPYLAPHAGSGTLTVEALDPEDKVLGSDQRRLDLAEGKGTWASDFRLTKELSVDDLAWHRLRYRFVYSGSQEAAVEGTDSISQVLRTPVMHLLGQQTYLSGGAAAVRVIVTDSKNQLIPGVSSLRVELALPKQMPRSLFTGRLDKRGTAEAQFRYPAGLVGTFPVKYLADTPLGQVEYTQQVRLEDKVSILLTTEKPIYQPGQTIHVRALAEDKSNHEASAGKTMTFEVQDPRGNKVFKKVAQTSKFGIASAEFSLADEVNLGTYRLRAVLGNDAAQNTAEIALNVERYTLPKFKVAVDFAANGNNAKHGYRPGDHVTGTVRANYFFGKPVDLAEVSVKATGMDVAQFEAGSAKGKTDAAGDYHFDFTLPRYFAGKPLTQGAARILVEATVKDSAGHSETRGEPVTVSESPLIVTAVPEGGTLIPGLDNQVFVLTSYADGKAAATEIKVRADGNPEQTVQTDEGGVAIIHIKGDGAKMLDVQASDHEGNRVSSKVTLESRQGSEQILLRTERAVYHAGDRMSFHILSTKSRGSAYIDIVKDGQTILTRDIDLVNGQAELTLAASPELAGTLDCSAYLFGSDARPVGDHRLVFVQPADELTIEATADAAGYKPGDEAHIRFHVTNSRGEGVAAALGVQVVDEAVFALAEKQPGFAKVFFYLEQEVMKPRYEIHSIGMPEIVEPVEKAHVEQRDRAARALFAATETLNKNTFRTDFNPLAQPQKGPEYTVRYQARMVEQVRQWAAQLNRDAGGHATDALIAKAVEKMDTRDAWQNKLQVQRTSWNQNLYTVRSAGPDKKFDTSDDLADYVQIRMTKTTAPAGKASVKTDIEHDRGPMNGLAEIAGRVLDQSGAGVGGGAVSAREVATGAVRKAIVSAAGDFRLTAIPAGEYEVSITQSGLAMASQKISLKVRDRAALTVNVAMTTEVDAIVVDQARQPRQMMMMGQQGAKGGFGGGGALGGVIGGIMPMMARAEMLMEPRAMPAPPPVAEKAMAMDAASSGNAVVTGARKDEGGAAPPRTRSYFPEALYINPEIITGPDGRASISIPLADSITTWRMAMMASTVHGALGSGSSSIKVFQDFFTDLDLPVTLTQGDRISIPVAVYNYSGTRGNVDLKLQPEDWYSMVEDTPEKQLDVAADRVGGSQFTVQAKRIGKFKLTLAARMGGTNRADIVVREIEVVPDGREQTMAFNGRLDKAVEHAVNFPGGAIPEAGKIYVRLYPGPLSQVIEGMDSILRMPGGCFEQTSSSTYPNVLALDYMKRTKKSTPEVHAKAEGYIANGYQRLLTFEVPGGGFSWFGNPPANKILTAYGLMEFSDMSKVYDVDANVIQRTQQWLASQQQPDGSWKPDTNFINEGATNRFNSDALRITAYLAWSLENTGYQGPAVEHAKQFVEAHLGGQSGAKLDAYTLAVVANLAADGKDRAFTGRAIQMLLDARTEKDEQAWWTSEETGVYGGGASASVETTGLAVQALLKSGEASATAAKALTYIASKKDATGAWGSTQATIMALRAVLLSTEKGAADVRGTVEITLNGRAAETLTLTADNNDLFHQFVLKGVDARTNQVALRFTGKGGLAYQVAGKFFVPWGEKRAGEALSIDVAYDRTQLAQDDIATATATVKNNLPKVANMVMVDLGIPPGFDLMSEDLQSYIEKSAGKKTGRLEKFSLTATQAILYFDSIGAGETIKLPFRLRAKYPIKARTFESKVYEYYNPEVNAVARPAQFEVRKK